MNDDDLEYYTGRARQERDAEASSPNAEATSAHRLLAIEYEAKADELRSQQQTRPTLKIRSA